MDQVEKQVAVVTGAANGIGRALAGRFVGAGMAVAIADIDERGLGEVAASLAATGAEVLAVTTDVTDPASIDRLAEQVLDRWAHVDVVCNNAGVMTIGASHEIPLDDWQRVFDVNLWGVVHGIRTFVPILTEQGTGHVVNVASGAGLISSPFVAPYCASKAAVISISESLLQELQLAGSAVNVSVVCPGFVRTSIAASKHSSASASANPIVGMVEAAFDAAVEKGCSPEEIAEAILAAIESGSFYVLPHDDIADAARARVEGMLAGQAPMIAAERLKGEEAPTVKR